ncbi:LPS export ABC transporter permease LptG [Candidatus Pseudothioglobus sp. Uisw_041]|jgi:lipopolysaccharide export system permease protein|uniref:LPS export ABC transporter permease LptG n=1 Tax=Candidatus Pseudothioglobus sp. Uisw_041 TaxID=3230996 RepID=UPI003A851A4E
MKIRDRYIAKTLLSYTIVVLMVWTSIYSFFNFLAELNSVGTEDYTILAAFTNIILQLPEVAYKQASPIILLGCILGMGHLATTGQLLIFRVSGASIFKITLLTLKNSLIFVLFFICIGEFLAPISSNLAKSSKLNAMGNSSTSFNQEGFWIRDGDNFINVKKNINGILFSGITVIEVNSLNKIERVIKSENAIFDGDSLDMSGSEIFSIDESNYFDRISLKERNSYDKTVSFDQDLINSLEKEPEDLSTWTLIKQIRFLSDNKLRSVVFKVELYKRLIQPITLIAMILLAMLFIFGSTRDVTLGRKIFFGVALGLSFEMLSRVASAMALGLDFSPFLSSILPSIVVMFSAVILLLKKSFS